MVESSSALSGREGKYEPIAELGRGGMATVVLAVVKGPAGFNKLQVIKRLRPALAADPDFLRMFLDEARLAARINHPNVVQTNEVGYDGHFYFIAMEYLDGQTLESISRKSLKTHQPLPRPMHLHALAETLAGLHYAHELTDFDGTPLNVVHRDVSPHNVMVGYDGHVKILDFGIAKAADSTTDTRTGIMKGKCAYMAPEQFGGMKVDRRADVFAVGVMLWQVLTGTRMWKGLSDSEIFARLARGEIPLPSSVTPVPEELERICMRALGQRPEDRFATAADFQTAIEQYMTGANLHVTPRELGKYLTELFAENRAAIRAAIEAQLSKPRLTSDFPVSAEVPVLDLLVPTTSTSEVRSSTSPPRITQTLPSSGSSGAQRPSHTALVVSLAVAAAGVGIFALTRHAAQPQPVPATAASVVTVADVPPPALVHLTMRATPPEARLFLDDAQFQSNPATGSFPKDGAAHRVRAEAPGYASKHEIVVFDTGTMSVDLALDREKVTAATIPRYPPSRPLPAPPPTAAAPPPEAVATPAPPPPPPPAPTTKPGLVLDTKDPWGGTSPPKAP